MRPTTTPSIRRPATLLATTAAFVFLATAPCFAKDRVPTTERKRRLASPAQSVVHGSNDFTFGLYNALSRGEGNRVVSPWSIRVALTMVGAGARGDTLTQMQRALSIGRVGPLVHEGYRTHLGELLVRESGRAEPAVRLDTANAAWFHEARPFDPTFEQILRQQYRSDAHRANFVEAPEEARGAINEWVGQRTEGRIRDLFPPGSIHGLTRLVLASAIHFEGPWQHAFPTRATTKAPFHLAGGGQVTASLMRLSQDLRVHERDGVQILELPYRGGALSMLVVLPKERDGLPALERALDTGTFGAWITGLETAHVRVTLPKFRFGHRPQLQPVLEQRGLADLFTPKADLSGIDGTRELFVHSIHHAATIEVDEAGTVAAAATGVAVGVESAPARRATFTADRPFLFLIREARTGAVLFIGRVSDPTAEE